MLERHQHRDQHRAGAMRRRHDERPGGETKEPGPQSDMNAVPVSVEEMKEPPGDQQHAREDAEGGLVDRHAEKHHGIDDEGD